MTKSSGPGFSEVNHKGERTGVNQMQVRRIQVFLLHTAPFFNPDDISIQDLSMAT